MDLKERQNIFRLLWEGLRLVNRSGSVLIVFMVVSVLLNAVGPIALHFGVSNILIQLYGMVISSFLLVVLFRLLAAKADNFGESFSNSLSAAVIPAVYMIVLNLFLGLISAAFFFVGGLVAYSLKTVGLILVLLVGLFVFVRLCFAGAAVALKDQGPIQAIIYSWQLTRHAGTFIRTFFMLLAMMLLPVLYIAAFLRTLYVVIPLYFADSFNLLNLSPEWYAVALGGGLLFLVVSFWSLATFVLFFLNCDYGENRGSYTPDAQADLFSQQTQVFGADNNVLPANLGKPVHMADVAGVNVVKSSVKTGHDAAGVQEHLSQVYQPQQNDVVEYADEDRMPTILFDDDMAKQIEENRKLFEHKKKEEPKKDTGEDTQTIKMSK